MAPEAYQLDSGLLARSGNDEIQLELFLDLASNVALYPKIPGVFPLEADPAASCLGQNGGAEAFNRDIRNAEVRFYDTGHFAFVTHHREIAVAIRDFLGRQVASKAITA